MANKINNEIEPEKNLSELFKELQDIRYGRAQVKETVKEKPKKEVKYNKIYVVDHRFNFAGAIIGLVFVLIFYSSINSTAIFASSIEDEVKVSVNKFEENEDKINIMSVISNNISELTKKEIVLNEVEIPFETEYTQNSQLPRDENKVIQEGQPGIINQTVIKTYENEELVEENIISEVTSLIPKKEVVEVGTSDFLKRLNVHINDTVYTTEQIILYAEADIMSTKLCYIYQDIDVVLKEINDETQWAQVQVDGYIGYVGAEALTSETLTPGIKEKSRIQRILVTVNSEIALNKPSGLSKEDFKKVLSGHNGDKNHIFENNAELFYEIEQKYKINGLFLAAMGIHESNWGTSTIAVQKKNLFGYGSYDSSPYYSSYTFESYEYGIELVAKVLVKYYINEAGTPIYDGETAVGSYYNGPTVTGVNTRYASDPNWSNRVYSIMVSLYQNLQ